MSVVKTAAAWLCAGCLALASAPALGQEAGGGLGTRLDEMAENIAKKLNAEAKKKGEQLRVGFRPAWFRVLGGPNYCEPLSADLRNALHERVEAWRREHRHGYNVVATDLRKQSPPEVTAAWSWDGKRVRVEAQLVLEGGVIRRVPAARLAAAVFDAGQRKCLFSYRRENRSIEAAEPGDLYSEPTYRDAAWVAAYDAGERLRVRGRLDPAEPSGVSWHVVVWRDPDTRRPVNLYTSDLAVEAPVPKVGEKFRDCPTCPEMVVVPAGSFMMGSPSSEEGRYGNEGPVHRVTIPAPFAVGKYEVTFSEWDACVSAGGCGGYRPNDWGWSRGRRPAINVSWNDARAYVRWLSEKTGKEYRLLSESEWEYAARAGTTTRYWWGNAIGRNRANCDGCGSRWDNEQTAPVGSFAANGFGLHDMHGNVWEWVGDCWNDSYAGAPSDGRAWESRNCGRRVLRGGSWYNDPRYLPRRRPRQVRHREPQRRQRVPCCPDAHPLNPYFLTSGVQGAPPPGRFPGGDAVS